MEARIAKATVDQGKLGCPLQENSSNGFTKTKTHEEIAVTPAKELEYRVVAEQQAHGVQN